MTGGHSFRVMRLSALREAEPVETGSAWRLNDFPKPRAGLHLFYLHGPYLRDIGSRSTLQPIRERLGNNREGGGSHAFDVNWAWWQEKEFEPKGGQILSLCHPNAQSTNSLFTEKGQARAFVEKTRQLIGSIHRALLANEFNDAPLIVFAHATVWNAIVSQSSRMEPASGPEDAEGGGRQFHEYLLWDDAELWNSTCWLDTEAGRLKRAWSGAGWPSLRLRQQTGDRIELPPVIREQLFKALNELVFYESENAPELDGDEGPSAKARYLEERQAPYLSALCEYLPKFFNPALGRYRTPHLWSGLPGGPRRVIGLGDLERAHRQLLLDGWLTPWLCQLGGNSGWYLHPSSLALMYWAAEQLSFPFGDQEPANFLDKYAWDHDCWFGGHLRVERAHGEDRSGNSI